MLIVPNKVNEVAGPPQSGKSTLCFDQVITYLKTHRGQAVIVDTIGSLSPITLAQQIESRQGDSNMLDRIQIMRTLDIWGVVEAIQEITSSFALPLALTQSSAAQEARRDSQIGIILIDTIANPLGLVMARGQSQGHDLMVSFMRELTLLNRHHGVCVILVNTVVKTNIPFEGSAFADVKIKPALGQTWRYLLDFSLFIHPVPEGSTRLEGKRGYIVEVIKSSDGFVGDWWLV